MSPTNIVNELLLSGKNKNQKKNIYVLKGFGASSLSSNQSIPLCEGWNINEKT